MVVLERFLFVPAHILRCHLSLRPSSLLILVLPVIIVLLIICITMLALSLPRIIAERIHLPL